MKAESVLKFHLSRTFTYILILNKPYENEVTLIGQNLPLKSFQPLEGLTYFEKGGRSFHAGKMRSVGQRAAK